MDTANAAEHWLRTRTQEATMPETPQSAPCLACGTTGGYMPRGYSAPKRTQRLCSRCYSHHYFAGTLGQFPHIPNDVIAASYAQRRAIQAHPLAPPAHQPAHEFKRDRKFIGAYASREWCERVKWEQQDTADRWPTCQPCERRGVA